ncbi:MAG: hypothetical protein QOD92_2728 [Acidimicrobiaceae bacterium]|jgi:hypothetical protein
MALEDCSREELATLVREYMMAGHMIDRAGMPHVMAELGENAFAPVAIEEWMGASPVYTKRMQRALGFEGDSVETIFKGMQFDIGAPPQFLDFRYRIDDHDHGEFWLDHCGALADVEPMGETFVHTMCHDIEDPTFDATAIATNARAQVRPVHRPPRVPADRSPVCHWTVTIADEHEPLSVPPEASALLETRAASIELSPIDPSEPGQSDYGGPLLSDIRHEDWSRSALVRIAEEICLEGHLLALSFLAALERRMDRKRAVTFGRRQFTGAAGLAAERLHLALGLDRSLDAVARVVALHPAFLPRQYVSCTVDLSDRLIIRLDADCAAVDDGGWLAMLDAEHVEPLNAIVRAIDPRYRCDSVADGGGLTFEVVMDDVGAPVAGAVELARISTGAQFTFHDRGTPVMLRSNP